MFCPFCGEDIAAEHKFCPCCGKDLPQQGHFVISKSAPVFKGMGDINLTESLIQRILLYQIDWAEQLINASNQAPRYIGMRESLVELYNLSGQIANRTLGNREKKNLQAYYYFMLDCVGELKEDWPHSDQAEMMADLLETAVLCNWLKLPVEDEVNEFVDMYWDNVMEQFLSRSSTQTVVEKPSTSSRPAPSPSSSQSMSSVEQEIHDLETELADMKPNISVTAFDPNKDYWRELQGLTGLDGVKTKLREHINNYKLQLERKKRHPDLQLQLSFNTIFKGHPGTGKTTVARLVAGILKNEGMLSGGQCVEVDATTLVSAWIGSSAKIAKLAALKAMGGVLFIDEAYTLAGGKGKSGDHGKEVIDALTPIFENNRNKLVVIMAGYDKEMDEMLAQVNTGFASRFRFFIHFDDYTPDEMMNIFMGMVYRDHYKMTQTSQIIVRGILDLIYKNIPSLPQFANARTVRNLYEMVCSRASKRMTATRTTEYDLLVDHDVKLTEEELRLVVGKFK